MNLRAEFDKKIQVKGLSLWDKVTITKKIPYIEGGEIMVGQPKGVFEITEIGHKLVRLQQNKKIILVTIIDNLEKAE